MLNNKVIVVTGASGRLGRRIVQAFAAKGASIAAIVRSEEAARNIPFPENGEGWAFPVDLANESLMRACFDQIRTHFSRVDALIHTAGTWEARPFAETSLEDWRRIMDVNLTTTFLCFREAIRVMEGSGRLIAFTSRQGADGGAAKQAGYSASKAAVIRLVEAIGEEYRDRGITAHAIAPSNIRFDEPGEGDDPGKGVRADDLIELCRSIITTTGDALNGATIRAYGNG